MSELSKMIAEAIAAGPVAQDTYASSVAKDSSRNQPFLHISANLSAGINNVMKLGLGLVSMPGSSFMN